MNEPIKKILGFASLGTAGAVAVLAMSLNAAPAAAQEVTLYKNPQCGCCEVTRTICARTVSRWR